ncbi:uncharacterized protein J8A68_002013 [[Candida] subhashii]|uniref:T6SS Phospholipase effector Tle1-like catalytic domain-containing protein n=1 Tax=[Candida] subhashii TaxID=561895 RepID=A0A8J5URB5_9ASCO|nr:uncharacterized protein J8A68_002013 [[Candida] subhashii]KAG7664457.1 hypothetical protein J8A68_002013 [[Candida] subhashii]
MTTDTPIIQFRDKKYTIEDLTNKLSGLEKELSPNKNLILCLDGTDNDFGPKPFTNVLQLFRTLEKDNPSQLCYYQPGIGSSFMADNVGRRHFEMSNVNHLSNRVDSMIAFTIKKHVLAAYGFLARFYNRGDKIFLFGFRYELL